MKRIVIANLLLLIVATAGIAQSKKNVTLKIEPDPVVLVVGEQMKPTVKAYDDNGNLLAETKLIYLGFGRSALRYEGFVPARGARLDSLGVHALEPGNFTGTVIRPGNDSENFAKAYFAI